MNCPKWVPIFSKGNMRSMPVSRACRMCCTLRGHQRFLGLKHRRRSIRSLSASLYSTEIYGLWRYGSNKVLLRGIIGLCPCPAQVGLPSPLSGNSLLKHYFYCAHHNSLSDATPFPPLAELRSRHVLRVNLQWEHALFMAFCPPVTSTWSGGGSHVISNGPIKMSDSVHVTATCA